MAKNQKNYGLIGIGDDIEIGKGGPRIKRVGDTLENRNNLDTDYARVKGADPQDPQDFVTKKFMETQANVSVTAQIDGTAPPVGAFVGQVAIVTTAGGGFSLKELYSWDGSAWEAINVFEGMRISVTDNLTGGTDTYLADHLYMWDEDGATWVDIGPATSVSNVSKSQRLTITNADADGNINIGAQLPTNAIVQKVSVNVTQAFNGTNPTLEIGDAGDADRFMATDEICLDKVGLYYAQVQHLYGADTQTLANLVKGVGNTQGSASILVDYVTQ